MEYTMIYRIYDAKGDFFDSTAYKILADDIAEDLGGYVDADEIGYDENDNGEDKIVYSTKEDNDDYLDYMDCECDNEE